MRFPACLPCCRGPQRDPNAPDVPGYESIERLGRGAEGEVWLCRDVETDEVVAIKLIRRLSEPWHLKMVEHEISIMLELGACHPNIVHPRELVLTPMHVGLVQEYMPGGTLAGYLKQHKVDEQLACYFFRQLIAAVEYCHRHRVAYRDIKLENTLLDTSSDPPRLVACDWGVAKRWSRGGLPQMRSIAGAPACLPARLPARRELPAACATPPSTRAGAAAACQAARQALHPAAASCLPSATRLPAGTPGYISPQMLEHLFKKSTRSYDATKSDVWSCGVLLCVMLMHRFPYGWVLWSCGWLQLRLAAAAAGCGCGWAGTSAACRLGRQLLALASVCQGSLLPGRGCCQKHPAPPLQPHTLPALQALPAARCPCLRPRACSPHLPPQVRSDAGPHER
jgi:serine/threonine protein kinase